MFQKIIILGVLFLSACCARAPLIPPDSFMQKDMTTDTFTLRTYQKLTDPNAAIKIYIEGDGNSFNGWGRPMRDPTPRGEFMRRLAFGDPSPNVVYMGRPCQFVNDPICKKEDWTDARFSAHAVDSMANVIKKIAIDRPVILIGFSGGAQMAGLISVLHSEIHVKKLITIGGNLDHPGWTRNNNLYPLDGSLDLNAYKEEYKKFPQIHYVGTNDDVIPPELTKRFVDDPTRVVEVPDASHGKGFETVYPLIWSER